MIVQSDVEFQSNLYESKNPTRRWIHQTRRDWVNGKLSEYVKPESSVLEVGTGCGIYTALLKTLSSNVTTIDVNPDFIESSKRLNPQVNSVVADIESYSAAEYFDVILMSEVLEHVPNTLIALTSISLLLKPGGKFILTTPNKFSTTELVARLLKFKAFALIARAIYGEPVDDLGHISLRTRKHLVSELTHAGFNVVIRDDLAFYLPAVAEFGGVFGKRVLQFLEHQLHKSNFLRNFLWTQCYVLSKP